MDLAIDASTVSLKGRMRSSSNPEEDLEGRVNTVASIPEINYSFEDVFKLCGDTGWWQIRIFFLAAFAGFPAGLQDFLYIFIAAIPKEYWCEVPDCAGYSNEQMKNWSLPLDFEENGYSYSRCSRYQFILNSANSIQNNSVVTCADESVIEFNYNVTATCRNYDFDNSIFQATIVTEWGLVCGQEFWASTSQAIYALGSLTGSIVFGVISDGYGRKRAIMIALITSMLFGVCVAFAPTFALFLIARYCLAISSPGIYDITYILLMEMIGSDWRGFTGNSFGIPYALGYAATAGFAYFFRKWRELQLVSTVPAAVFLIGIYFIPESPRWLISKGKSRDAEKILRQIAKTNKRQDILPENFSEIVTKLCKNKSGTENKWSWRQNAIRGVTKVSDLFRTPKMRRRTILLNICWISTVLVYFGSALNGPNLTSDLFLYTGLSGVLEIPSYLIAVPLTNLFGRRYVFAGLLFVCGCSLGFSLLFSPDTTGIVALSLLGKFHVGSAYALLFLYGIELMPTSLRAYGIGTAAISGKIGNAAAPYISGLMGNINQKSPAIVFAVVSLGASLLSLLLPETKGKKLPETVEDVEHA